MTSATDDHGGYDIICYDFCNGKYVMPVHEQFSTGHDLAYKTSQVSFGVAATTRRALLRR